MHRKVQALAATVLLGLGVFWVLSIERPLGPDALPKHVANIENGKLIYNVGGCISCHASATDPEVPSGGKPLKSPIGLLYPPNLTPDKETGLGNWDDLAFVNAMQRGLKRGGGHLIPAFPYTSYVKMNITDVLDVKAYLAQLPAVKNITPEHEVIGLALVRRGLGLWKWLGMDATPLAQESSQTANWNRGNYLVNGPGHCQECHTPRNLIMARKTSAAFAGGPHPEGKGRVPSLRNLVGRGRFKDNADLVLAFQNGEALGYDHMSSGGMGEVQSNLAKLPEAELQAIAEYILSLQ